MSAAELLKQVRALPRRERQKFLQSVLTLEEAPARSNRKKKRVKWPAALRIAASLSDHHSAVVGTRSLDILHVAAAKLLHTDEFVSFDIRQRTLAAAAGLKVGP
jgi:hypothetical protein